MSVDKYALRVDNVFKRYTKPSFLGFGRSKALETQALKDVSFTIERGGTMGLLGPNGSGKTTLLKIVSTLLEPSSGSVTLNGIDIGKNPRKARGRIGLVTCDERSFYWRLSGRENLKFFGALYGLSSEVTRRRSEVLLEMLGLGVAADRPFQSYSSGMKQKLAIARGLLSEPELILYDEPTRSLDPLSAFQIRQWLMENRKKNQAQTHLIATNQLQEAEQLCDRVVIVSKGVLLASGTVAEIRDTWTRSRRELYEVVYEGEMPRQALISAAGANPIEHIDDPERQGRYLVKFECSEVDGRLSAVLAALTQAGATIVHCRSQQASFDEIFRSLVEAAPLAKAEVAQ
jgi:ABC-2 type transport system ATP-binding protein